ncbi:hypothetical protein RFZ45_21665, partial [Acinetobacter baumannii]|nr:hypothetical protein [Acinetobacter baumannii]
VSKSSNTFCSGIITCRDFINDPDASLNVDPVDLFSISGVTYFKKQYKKQVPAFFGTRDLKP